MADNPEVTAQLARLLGMPERRSDAPEELQRLVQERFSLLTDALVQEAAASDDVSDRESALAFLTDRLAFLQPALSRDQVGRLQEALRDRIKQW
jgi:hypothetical protein